MLYKYDGESHLSNTCRICPPVQMQPPEYSRLSLLLVHVQALASWKLSWCLGQQNGTATQDILVSPLVTTVSLSKETADELSAVRKSASNLALIVSHPACSKHVLSIQMNCYLLCFFPKNSLSMVTILFGSQWMVTVSVLLLFRSIMTLTEVSSL